MNKEEIYQSIEHIAKCGLYDTIEVNFLKSKFDELQQKNEQLKDNWNKLKEIIRKKQDYYRHFKDNRYRKFLSELLDIMQELEQGEII